MQQIEPLPYDCVVPCAGISSRMNGWKPLTKYRGRPLLFSAIENALTACIRVILVTGFRAAELEEMVRREYGNSARIQLVRNAEYERGMFSSIQTGAACISSCWFFVALGDMPAIPPQLYIQLAEYTRPGSGEAKDRRGCHDIIRPVYRGKPAHPVLLHSSVVRTLRKMPTGVTMQKMFAQHRKETGNTVLKIEVNEAGSRIDIDTSEDLQKLEPREE